MKRNLLIMIVFGVLSLSFQKSSVWKNESTTKEFIYDNFRMSYQVIDGKTTVQFKYKDSFGSATTGRDIYKKGLGFVKLSTVEGGSVKFFVNEKGVPDSIFDGYFVFSGNILSKEQVGVLKNQTVNKLHISGIGYTNTTGSNRACCGPARLNEISSAILEKYPKSLPTKEEVHVLNNCGVDGKKKYSKYKELAFGRRRNSKVVFSLIKKGGKTKMEFFVDLSRHCLDSKSTLQLSLSNGEKIILSNDGVEGCSTPYGNKATFSSRKISKKELIALSTHTVKAVSVQTKEKLLTFPFIDDVSIITKAFACF